MVDKKLIRPKNARKHHETHYNGDRPILRYLGGFFFLYF